MSYIEKFWRDATDKDVVDVMNGKEVEARFRDRETEEWTGPQRLAGAKFPHGNAKLLWICGSYGWWYCQVYSPPQWWLNKPEPGEGYRLLEKEPDEALQPGDEAFGANGRWSTSYQVKSFGVQVEGIWYRRKIEPKPEPKYKVGQRVRIIGPKVRPAAQWEGGMDQYIGLVDVVDRVHPYGPKSIFFHLEGIKERDFREDYLEPVVDPEPKHYVLQVGDTADHPNGLRITITEHGVEVT